MTPRVVLVGPSGAGKTTIGQALAGALGCGFRDTDTDVEGAAGKTVADIFVLDGEERFRELERAAVTAALAEHDGVLSLGGGAVMDDGIRASLQSHRVVFLDVGLADAVKRVGMNRDRPLLLGNPRAQLRGLMEERRPLYEEVATVRVLTDGRQPADVAAEIATALDLS